MSDDVNNQLILIAGQSTTGKSMSLRNLPNQEKGLYLNTEAGKRLPFKSKFVQKRIVNPYQVFEAFQYARANPDMFDYIILDSLTFWFDMVETQVVLNAENTQQGWGEFQQIFKRLMQQEVASFGKPVIILAHTREDFNEQKARMDSVVPVKGALKNNGVEAYFSTVVHTVTMPISELEKDDGTPLFDPELLHITEEERLLGVKHVFQTQLTKKTLGNRIRSPFGMFNRSQIYMDNDAFLLLKHLHSFYND